MDERGIIFSNENVRDCKGDERKDQEEIGHAYRRCIVVEQLQTPRTIDGQCQQQCCDQPDLVEALPPQRLPGWLLGLFTLEAILTDLFIGAGQ